jgi:hypothetical protein
MSKKGEFDPISDMIFAAIILVLAIFISWLLITGKENEMQIEIKLKDKELHNDDIFSQVLRTRTDQNTDFTDLIVSSYTNENTEVLKEQMNSFLKKIYTQDLCWSLYIDNKYFTGESCSANQLNNILKSTAIVPTKNSPLNLTMEINDE